MSRYHPAWDIKSLLQAAHHWLESCFVADNSLFSASSLWTLENATILRNAFVDNLLEGSEGFYEKLDMQLSSTPPAAKQLMAEMLWLLMLMQSNIKPTTKRENLAKVWGWSGTVLPP
jgi:5-methylcytosine-specific restriction protein B